MLAKILSGAVVGVDGYIVQVQVDLTKGLPIFSTVGLPEGAVRESKDRVKAAVKNCGYKFPSKRITVNLAPASIKKEGAGYDLPIALGILAASEIINCVTLEKYGAVGELSLDGKVCSVRGVLPIILAARQEGIKRFFVPQANADEAAVVKGIEIIAVGALDETVEILSGRKHFVPASVDVDKLFSNHQDFPVDYIDVKGQEYAKRAMEVAAAGGHNILLNGVPGTGKTMMARRLTTILPKLQIEESLETTKVYSSTGLMPDDMPLVVSRPFRSPHHTVSDAGLIGGGQIPRPGEVSLAHNGVLFLDELTEFKKNVLEVMRQPLEDGIVTISRASTSLQFPARFMLVAAMNPCPCGYFGDTIKECTCSPVQVQRYQNRLSGPLLDRIDIHVEVPAVKVSDIEKMESGADSASMRKRVNSARRLQEKRFVKTGVHCNAQMNSAMLKEFCQLDSSSISILRKSVEHFGLSARAYNRIVKISRTIADLDNALEISTKHITEAVQYRRSLSANV